MSSVAICAICFEDARPLLEDLQSISACGHVFHDHCLHRWMEYFQAGRDPTCPTCKQTISCPTRDVHRLYFQSTASDSLQSQVSPSRNLQTTVEGRTHVMCHSAFRELESKLAAATTFVCEQFKELESQVKLMWNLKKISLTGIDQAKANLLRAENAEAAATDTGRELAQCRRSITSVQEELVCCLLELEKVQEENQAMAKVLDSHDKTRRNLLILVQDILQVEREDRDNLNLLEAQVERGT